MKTKIKQNVRNPKASKY